MKICEQFATLQGEGKYVGVPSFFIRTTGCNLRCAWKNPDGSITRCDTPYSSWEPEHGGEVDVNAIIDLCDERNINHIVITGGEPMLQPDIEEVAKAFIKKDFIVTIETNGTIYKDIPGAFFSISPKLKSSYSQVKGSREARMHENNNKHLLESLKALIHHKHQLKFVVNTEDDINEINMILQKIGDDNSNVYLMPQGITEEQFKQKQKMMFDLCMEYGFNYTPRLHIDIFGNKRGV